MKNQSHHSDYRGHVGKKILSRKPLWRREYNHSGVIPIIKLIVEGVFLSVGMVFIMKFLISLLVIIQ
jgi:hypothetical protein